MDLRTHVARVVAPLSIALLGACADDAAKTDTSNTSDATEATESETTEADVEDTSPDSVEPEVADTTDAAADTLEVDAQDTAETTDTPDTADTADTTDTSDAEVVANGTLSLIEVGTPVALTSDGDLALLQDFASPEVDVYLYNVLSGVLEKKTTLGSPLENFATGLSDGGRITALYSSPIVAGAWTLESGWEVIPSPFETGCDNSRGGAWDVSAEGDVVVGFFWDGCTTEAFRWTDASGEGVVTPLQRIGNSLSETLAPVNRATVVSGDGRIAAGFAENLVIDRSAAIWREDGTGFFLAPDEVETPSEVLAINYDGSIVAGAWGYSGFMWSEATGFVDTGIPPEGLPSDRTYINAIAADGDLLFGTSGDNFFGVMQAIVWTKDGGARLLANVCAEQGVVIPEGYVLNGVLAASRDGSIVLGTALDLDSPFGAQVSFVLELPASAYF